MVFCVKLLKGTVPLTYNLQVKGHILRENMAFIN